MALRTRVFLNVLFVFLLPNIDGLKDVAMKVNRHAAQGFRLHLSSTIQG